VTDPEVLAKLDMPDDETCVEEDDLGVDHE
jgi:hypothetical protein